MHKSLVELLSIIVLCSNFFFVYIKIINDYMRNLMCDDVKMLQRSSNKFRLFGNKK